MHTWAAGGRVLDRRARTASVFNPPGPPPSGFEITPYISTSTCVSIEVPAICSRGAAIVVYDAFISYSHAKDKPIAAALQSAMQRLGKPWYRRRAMRVFRDDTSLSATPELWPSIERALDHSRIFILLASPEAAASKWVNREVAHWLDHQTTSTLLIGLTDGKLIW